MGRHSFRIKKVIRKVERYAIVTLQSRMNRKCGEQEELFQNKRNDEIFTLYSHMDAVVSGKISKD